MRGDAFLWRHIGPRETEIASMLKTLEFASLEELVEQAIPQAIRLKSPLRLGDSHNEYDLLRELQEIAQENQVFRSFIGMGYANCITPP